MASATSFLTIRRRADLPILTPFGQRLAWTLLALAVAIVPHVPHLALWVTALATASGVLRMVIEVRHWSLPPRWLRTLLAFGVLLGVLVTYRTVNGIDAGTGLLVAMAGMKLTETRTLRDLTLIVFLAYFCLFAGFLYNQDLIRVPYMLVAAWLLTATLMRIHQSTVTMPVREALNISGRMFLQALPLAVLLFLFLPRLPGQFWSVPARTQALSGLSEEMTPGDVSELSLSSAAAFRVQFNGPVPPPKERYWRGPVLREFDGRTWRRLTVMYPGQEVTAKGPFYRYRLTLEPHNRNWVFALDVVSGWPEERANRNADLQLTTPFSRRVSTVTSFDLTSSTQWEVTGQVHPSAFGVDLRLLPPNRNPRTRALAQEILTSVGGDKQAFIDAVLKRFTTDEFYYTLQPPALALDSVDDFLFNTKRGFCEHYASAFTVLARAAGIPARIVTGYQGGERNPLDGSFLIRQSDAHAWSEVWLERRGWVRVDPTAAISPARIEQGIDAALSDDEPVPGRFIRRNSLLAQARFAWDAVNAFWKNQVIDFGVEQQEWLLERLNLEGIELRYLGVGLVGSLIAFFVGMSAYLTWRFRPRQRDPVVQVYDQLCRKLARHQLPRFAHEGPNDYLARVVAARPNLAKEIAEVQATYISLRYGPHPLASQLSRLKFLVNQFAV